eukprot:TRINITY_DN9382_c0_g1_i12.p1 TRINITY_DN9382_c0_g1~~TRINITY_DN9382_c0_g1_i12.p1  ORF type:complete len:180 (+),score=25.42 TRINITY_DN9382_c0_g1_i12:73-612(+)
MPFVGRAAAAYVGTKRGRERAHSRHLGRGSSIPRGWATQINSGSSSGSRGGVSQTGSNGSSASHGSRAVSQNGSTASQTTYASQQRSDGSNVSSRVSGNSAHQAVMVLKQCDKELGVSSPRRPRLQASAMEQARLHGEQNQHTGADAMVIGAAGAASSPIGPAPVVVGKQGGGCGCSIM